MNYTEKETKMQRESFVIYKSFIKAMRNLPASKFKKLMLAISDYALDDIEADLDEIMLDGMFELMKPQIDANKRRYDNGKKGGRPKQKANDNLNNNLNQTETKPNQKANDNLDNNLNNNLNQTETKPNVNVNVNDNVNVNIKENLEEKKEKKEKINKKEKKEKKYACDEILEEALNKSDVNVLLNDLGVNEEFVKDLIFYRDEIEKPIKTTSGLKGLLKDILEASLKSRKSPQELVETMKENEWKTIKYDYLAPSELGPPKNYTKKDVVSQNMDAVRQAIEMRKRMKGAV